MTLAVIIAAVILIIIILFYLFRVNVLVSVMRGEHKNRTDNFNKLNGVLFAVFLVVGMGAFFWYSNLTFEKYDIPLASKHGKITDKLFWITMAITGFVFVATHILLFVFPYKYRYRKSKQAYFYPHNTKLEIVWTVIPAIVLILLVSTGITAWNNITDDAPKESVVVEVVGKQFNWMFRYPGPDGKLGRHDFRKIDASNAFGLDLTDEASFDDFMANTLVIPKGRPVNFKIRALDVLHSVYIKEFRLKMDAVPGQRTQFWFEPTKTTEEMRTETNNPEYNYKINCAEICGKNHFAMAATVEVVESEDFEDWYTQQPSWLSLNPEYLNQVPGKLKEKARMQLPVDTTAVGNNADTVLSVN